MLGYTITFSKSGEVTIYNSKDGSVPALGVKQDGEDWYWTVDGEWLLDTDGNKVRASAKDGKPGIGGASGITPTLKIEDGYWYVSYDGGKTFSTEAIGQATGEKGDSMFAQVTYDGDCLYVTMTDGQQFVIPLKRGSEEESVVASCTISINEITASTVTFKGLLDVAEVDRDFSIVTVRYSESDDFNVMNEQLPKASTVTFDRNGVFTIKLEGLTYNTTYKYCVIAKVRTREIYSDKIMTFTTSNVVAPSYYTDLSAVSTANCYIVSQSGRYCMSLASGNKWSPSLHSNIKTVAVLWESFGLSVAPGVGDLIKLVSYNDGYITFQTADRFKEGNAVIAAKDADDNILWSWHIWFTDEPQGQEYFKNSCIIMDRNLGAISAIPGDVGALGLLYQWGRKDPFLGSSSISSNVVAESTLMWPSDVRLDSSSDAIAYAIANPTTFIRYITSSWDWVPSTDNTLWTTSSNEKSIYDPCPAGWRVPDGGSNGLWVNASGFSSDYEWPFNQTNKGFNFSGIFGSASTIWYPAAGALDGGGGLMNVGEYGYHWSASPRSNQMYALIFGNDCTCNPSYDMSRAYGLSVRCVQEIN